METLSNTKEIKTKKWSLIYSQDFEVYREKYKNIVSAVKSLIEGEKIEGLNIEKIESESFSQKFILDLNGERFFVKKNENGKQGGVGEFNSNNDIKEILSKKGVEDVEVSSCLFGFTQGDIRYTVYLYDERLQKSLRSYLDEMKLSQNENAEINRLMTRVNNIKEILDNYHDVTTFNMGYNKESDTIILYDLNRKSDLLVEGNDDDL